MADINIDIKVDKSQLINSVNQISPQTQEVLYNIPRINTSNLTNDIVCRVENIEDNLDTPGTTDAVIAENSFSESYNKSGEILQCIICLEEDVSGLFHFSFFSFHCECNYHIHYKCLTDWIKQKLSANKTPCCMLCYSNISSYEYKYINFKNDTQEASRSAIDILNSTTSSTDTDTSTETLTSIVTILSDNMDDIVNTRNTVYGRRLYDPRYISIQNRILENIFNNSEIRQIYSRRQIEQVVEREVNRRRFMERVVIQQEVANRNGWERNIAKLIISFFIIVSVILLIIDKTGDKVDD